MILYFTGTGNSRFVAGQLGKMLDERVVSINDYLKSGKRGNFKSDMPYVFVVPTYMSRMPMRVENFLRDSRFEKGRKAYFVFTAGQAVGNACKYCEKLCKEKQLDYSGAAAVKMPANYVVMYDVLPKEDAKAAAEKAIPEIRKIAGVIRRDERLGTDPKMAGHKSFSMIAPAFTALMVSAKSFHAGDGCVGCGACQSVCPLNNIHLKDGKPVWGGECMHCMACISICPHKAIDYGNKTADRNRYYLSEAKEDEL